MKGTLLHCNTVAQEQYYTCVQFSSATYNLIFQREVLTAIVTSYFTE